MTNEEVYKIIFKELQYFSLTQTLFGINCILEQNTILIIKKSILVSSYIINLINKLLKMVQESTK